jgi:hypothetical protein
VADDAASLKIQVTPESANGVFADFVGVWHNQYGFTLDFGVMGLTETSEDGRPVVPTQIVARVKVPPGLIFQIAQAIADNVDKYEHTYGPITPSATPPPD